MNKLNFFESKIKGKNRYFCVSQPNERVCSGCNQDIKEPVGLFCYSLSKNFRYFGVYHFGCKNKVPKKVVYQEIGVFTFVEERLPNSSPVFFGNKTVKDSKANLSVFEVSFSPADVTKDKTKYAGRESWEGASVGLLPDERKETPEYLLNQTKNSTHLLEGREGKPSLCLPKKTRKEAKKK